jgi:hypothetical protein
MKTTEFVNFVQSDFSEEPHIDMSDPDPIPDPPPDPAPEPVHRPDPEPTEVMILER